MLSDVGSELGEALPEADVYLLHWVAGFVDPRSVFVHRRKDIPVVWRPSDLNPFTGGCHYDHGCERFVDSCGRCPYLGSTSRLDLSHRELKRKQGLYSLIESAGLHVVAQSEWMRAAVNRSRVWRNVPVTVIPNGLDLEVFRPRDRRAIRAALEIDGDGPVVAFVADDLSNVRKGVAVLSAAAESLTAIDGVQLLSVGAGGVATPRGVAHRRLGPVHDDRLLAQVYSAADVFVIPSLQDNSPNTAIESMACGTAVVGSATGGIPELVEDGVTGVLVEPGNPGELGRVLTELCNDRTRLEQMGRAARRRAEDRFSDRLCSERYEALFSRLSGSRSRSS
jgi:glycosyltransferase involved in cell wall biosynthesis